MEGARSYGLSRAESAARPAGRLCQAAARDRAAVGRGRSRADQAMLGADLDDLRRLGDWWSVLIRSSERDMDRLWRPLSETTRTLFDHAEARMPAVSAATAPPPRLSVNPGRPSPGGVGRTQVARRVRRGRAGSPLGGRAGRDRLRLEGARRLE